MEYTIENDFLKVSISSLGAELSDVYSKKLNAGVLWRGDAAFWRDRAPVLFPFVGRLNDNKYMHEGKIYEMQIHGFAKKSEFTAADIKPDQITFKLAYDEETLRVYPFKFEFYVAYGLKANELTITYNAVNLGDSEMYFSVGGHPGFNCPLFADEKFSDYSLVFSEKETADILLSNEKVYFTGETRPFLKNESVIPLSYELFKHDALVFENLKSKSITLKSNKNYYKLEIDISQFPYLGIWTKKDAPYVCIEPWRGIGCFDGCEGELKDKQGIIRLNKKERSLCWYVVKIL